MNDLKFAFRQLAKTPGFTFVAILILALGIGFSASSFSVANALLLRDLPYLEPDRLVRIFGTSRDTNSGGHAPANLYDLRESTKAFAGVAMFNPDRFSLGNPGQPAEQVAVTLVSANFFDVLGTHPTLGRGFQPEEDQPGKTSVTILSHGTWVNRYAGDPKIIGQSVRLGAQPYTVVGVLPPSFDAPLVWGPTEYFCVRAPYPGMRLQRNGSRWMQGVARLKPGVSVAAAQNELTVIAQQLAIAYPKDNAGRGLRVTNLHDSNMNQTTRSILWLMTGLSVAMMLIACANLAGLQVARALRRHRDYAVRAALGGSRRQLMVPLLAEGFLLALAGGIAGVLVAVWSNQLVGHYLVLGTGRGLELPVDGHVLAFAAGSALFSGLAFSLMPAWLSARAPAADALKENSRGSTTSREQNRLKNTLIVGQIAAAFALVGVGASFGVGMKSFLHRDLGWQVNGLFSGDVVLPGAHYDAAGTQASFVRSLLDRLAVLPGVDHVTVCSNLPTFYFGGTKPITVEGRPPEEPGQEPIAYWASVSSDYFTTLGIALKQGAPFASDLKAGDPPVAIVNESFARQFWPGKSALGQRVRLGPDEPWLEIVGVVADIQVATQLATPPTRLQLYRPFVQWTSRYFSIVIRSRLAPDALTKQVRATVAALDSDLPVSNAGSVQAFLQRVMANNDLIIVNFGISAGMGLLIATVGLFGVISQLTLQRSRDIGIRIALGAAYGNIMNLVFGEGLKLLIAGIPLGAMGYFVLSTVLSRSMPEVQFPGLGLLAVNLLVLSAVMFLTCYFPARRATRIDPMVALRTD